MEGVGRRYSQEVKVKVQVAATALRSTEGNPPANRQCCDSSPKLSYPRRFFLCAGSSFTTGAPSHSPGAYGDNCDGIGRTRLAQQPATGIGIGRGSERPVLQAVASGQSHWRNAMRLKHSLCFVYFDRFDSRKDCDSSDIGDASRQMHDGSDMSSGTSRNVRGRLICLHDGHTSSLFTPQ